MNEVGPRIGTEITQTKHQQLQTALVVVVAKYRTSEITSWESEFFAIGNQLTHRLKVDRGVRRIGTAEKKSLITHHSRATTHKAAAVASDQHQWLIGRLINYTHQHHRHHPTRR